LIDLARDGGNPTHQEFRVYLMGRRNSPGSGSAGAEWWPVVWCRGRGVRRPLQGL